MSNPPIKLLWRSNSYGDHVLHSAKLPNGYYANLYLPSYNLRLYKYDGESSVRVADWFSITYGNSRLIPALQEAERLIKEWRDENTSSD